MITIKRGTQSLHAYPPRAGVPAGHGWNEFDPLFSRGGELVTFASTDEAQAWIDAHAVFADGAVIVEA